MSARLLTLLERGRSTVAWSGWEGLRMLSADMARRCDRLGLTNDVSDPACEQGAMEYTAALDRIPDRAEDQNTELRAPDPPSWT